jgi:hypothetical protein
MLLDLCNTTVFIHVVKQVSPSRQRNSSRVCGADPATQNLIFTVLVAVTATRDASQTRITPRLVTASLRISQLLRQVRYAVPVVGAASDHLQRSFEPIT